MKYLYKYPQREFPYRDLVETNRGRSREELEYELLDTGIFDDDRYFDVFVEYAKAGPEDLLVRVSVHNRGPEPARLHLLPTLWFRNTWSWGDEGAKPVLRAAGRRRSWPRTPSWATYTLACDGTPELLFTENESNAERLWGQPNPAPYVKDAFHRYVVAGERDAVNPAKTGTKAAAHYVARGAGGRLRGRPPPPGRGARAGVRRGFDEALPAAARRRRRVLRPDHPAVARARTSAGSTARRSPGCSGRSSTTTSTSTAG